MREIAYDGRSRVYRSLRVVHILITLNSMQYNIALDAILINVSNLVVLKITGFKVYLKRLFLQK